MQESAKYGYLVNMRARDGYYIRLIRKSCMDVCDEILLVYIKWSILYLDEHHFYIDTGQL